MSGKENRNDRSEKVQALLSSPLQWQLRWGTLLIISILLSLAAILPFINYNDTLSVKVLVFKQQNAGIVQLICTDKKITELKPGSAISLATTITDQPKAPITGGVITKIDTFPGKGFTMIEMQTGMSESTAPAGTEGIATITFNRSTLYDKLVEKD